LVNEADDQRPITSPGGIRWARIAIVIGGAVVLYLVGRWVSQILVSQFSLLMRPHNEPLLHRTIMTATVIYIILMAIPFTPAVEIGFSMLMIFGGKIAFLVYVSTVVALMLAYLAGRLVPAELAAKVFGLFGLVKAQGFANRLAPLSGQERLALLVRDSRARWVPRLVRHRYLALAVLLNLPGNVVVGGGGGIALAAGMTRLFTFPAYLFTVALAVAPVPLMIVLAG
jgi:hypothetical protein